MPKYTYSDQIKVYIYDNIGKTTTMIKVLEYCNVTGLNYISFAANKLKSNITDKDLLEFIEKSLAQFKKDPAIEDEKQIEKLAAMIEPFSDIPRIKSDAKFVNQYLGRFFDELKPKLSPENKIIFVDALKSIVIILDNPA